jgi:hypothetical protein
MVAVGVVVVVLATVFFVAWLKDAPVRRMIGFLEKDVQSDSKYVEEMAGQKRTLKNFFPKGATIGRSRTLIRSSKGKSGWFP